MGQGEEAVRSGFLNDRGRDEEVGGGSFLIGEPVKGKLDMVESPEARETVHIRA